MRDLEVGPIRRNSEERHKETMTSTFPRAPGGTVRAGHVFLPFLLALLLSGCAARSLSVGQEEQVVVAAASPEPSELTTQAPSFLLKGTQAQHNRIGRVEARKDKAREIVSIDTDLPAIYADTHQFQTSTGTYTNLVYRIHFPEVPFSIFPFYLGAGENVGILVILTLDAKHRPLLVTTVNSCGCYAVSIPTELLAPDLYPDGWPAGRLSVYGEKLPGRLPAPKENEVIQVVVRADVHRVMDIQVVPRENPQPEPVVQARVLGLKSLEKLPLGDGTFTSFYYDRWPLTGHVKGAMKPWESVFLSWASLDFFVGMDKAFDEPLLRSNHFYTSLKPWNRTASDLNDFPAYLRFNGWKL